MSPATEKPIGGVGIIAPGGRPFHICSALTAAFAALVSEGRAMRALIRLNCGVVVQVLNVYFWAGANTKVDRAILSNNAVEAIRLELAAAGPQPTILPGDINTDIARLPNFQELITHPPYLSDTWRLWHPDAQPSEAATCFASEGAKGTVRRPHIRIPQTCVMVLPRARSDRSGCYLRTGRPGSPLQAHMWRPAATSVHILAIWMTCFAA